jgi:ABC-type sugar transport system ATPase subunit
VRRGEANALVGENGDGKSTLVKVLPGFYPRGSYGGDIVVDGAFHRIATIRDSEYAGEASLFLEPALVKQTRASHTGAVLRPMTSPSATPAPLVQHSVWSLGV